MNGGERGRKKLADSQFVLIRNAFSQSERDKKARKPFYAVIGWSVANIKFDQSQSENIIITN